MQRFKEIPVKQVFSNSIEGFNLKLLKMKIQALILLSGFILMSLFTNAQSKNDTIQVNKTTPFGGAAKGYYSIYHNAQKLNEGSVQLTFRQKRDANETKTNTLPLERKGYYAIRNNQLNNRIYLLNANSSGKRNQIVPEVKKGYYSIGRNAEKLQK